MTVTALFTPADRKVLADMVEDLACRMIRGDESALTELAGLLACPAGDSLAATFDGVREAVWVRDALASGAMCWQDRYSHDDLTGFGSNAEAAIEMATGQAADEIDRLINAHGGNHER